MGALGKDVGHFGSDQVLFWKSRSLSDPSAQSMHINIDDDDDMCKSTYTYIQSCTHIIDTIEICERL